MLFGEPTSAQKAISPAPNAPALQPPQREGSATQQAASPEQRGSEDHPVVVKVLPAEKTAEERAQEQHDRSDKSSADWWLIRLTGALAFVGILQFAALIVQAIVFRVQATALRESVDLTRNIADRQERDMRDSITEAARAATAMRDVAEAAQISANAAQRAAETPQRVERAYVSGGGEAQGRDGQYNSGYFRIDVNNYGKTPGEIIRIRYGHCDIGWLDGQKEPAWAGTEDWIEWIAPNTPSRRTIFPHIPKSDGHLVVYGRIYYRDIFRRGHSCGFILRVKSDGTTDPIAAPSPDYTQDRDEPDDDA
jgi:hypothetical protein